MMKLRYGFTPIRLLILLVWGVLAIVLTTQSDRVPLVRLMTRTIGSTDVGDAVGHAGLFGVLTFAIYMVLAIKLKREWALPFAMLVTLVLGLVTELAQMGVISRVASLSDLLANALGIFVVGFTVSYWSMLRSRRAFEVI
ncbi:MAG: VanZ family protein [Chloroflexi bacterium]|nr:VanZ family protein [Chloroflexota bacterium]